ncbi:hypothetical protein NDU88_005495 [Pleurodeles waltl]|uniref:Uncharacterized protein n=1 Tax=Pleurodeles waltl TaxID=8319 RepID=A0AAV7NQS5_PLEWA|nr:hypothetical protein NDU88_005495 [Pleurodeles waltl]
MYFLLKMPTPEGRVIKGYRPKDQKNRVEQVQWHNAKVAHEERKTSLLKHNWEEVISCVADVLDLKIEDSVGVTLYITIVETSDTSIGPAISQWHGTGTSHPALPGTHLQYAHRLAVFVETTAFQWVSCVLGPSASEHPRCTFTVRIVAAPPQPPAHDRSATEPAHSPQVSIGMPKQPLSSVDAAVRRQGEGVCTWWEAH